MEITFLSIKQYKFCHIFKHLKNQKLHGLKTYLGRYVLSISPQMR